MVAYPVPLHSVVSVEFEYFSLKFMKILMQLCKNFL